MGAPTQTSREPRGASTSTQARRPGNRRQRDQQRLPPASTRRSRPAAAAEDASGARSTSWRSALEHMCASSTANSSGSESNNKARNTAGAKTHKAAEIRIETETSTAGEAGGHRAPRPPHQVLHASGARGRPVQHADEPAGAEHFKRKSQEGDKYCFRGSQAHSTDSLAARARGARCARGRGS